MKIYRLPEEAETAKREKRKTAVALGFFDGVHLGHRALLLDTKGEAERQGISFSVLTFPSESKTLKADSCRLTSTEEKLRILESLGVNTVYLCDFERIKDLSPAAFVTDILSETVGAAAVETGEDFRFGRKAEGDAAMLRTLSANEGIACRIFPTYKKDGETVSSLTVRRLLSEGKTAGANALLGAPIAFSGTVGHGIGLAGKEGIPTANVTSEKLALFKPGVYLGAVTAEGEENLPAILNIGVCPTVGMRDLHAEIHLFDRSLDLYGKKITVSLLEFIRAETTFSSEKELFLQINVDILTAKAAWRNHDVGNLDKTDRKL